MLELCKLYKIESIKCVSGTCGASTAGKKPKLADEPLTYSTNNDPKEKENELINKIKSQLSESAAGKHEFKFDTVRDNVFSFKKLTDLASLKLAETRLQNEIQVEEAKYTEEIEKRKKYRVRTVTNIQHLFINSYFNFMLYFVKTDALRRKHVYDEFIVTYLKILSENGKLAEIIRSNGCLAQGNSNHSSNSNGQTIGPLFLQQPTSKKRKK